MSRAIPVFVGAMLAACSADPSEVELRQQGVVAYWPERALIFIGDARDSSVRAISTRNPTPVLLWQRQFAGTGSTRIDVDRERQHLSVRNGRHVFFPNPENGALEYCDATGASCPTADAATTPEDSRKNPDRRIADHRQ